MSHISKFLHSDGAWWTITWYCPLAALFRRSERLMNLKRHTHLNVFQETCVDYISSTANRHPVHTDLLAYSMVAEGLTSWVTIDLRNDHQI